MGVLATQDAELAAVQGAAEGACCAGHMPRRMGCTTTMQCLGQLRELHGGGGRMRVGLLKTVCSLRSAKVRADFSRIEGMSVRFFQQPLTRVMARQGMPLGTGKARTGSMPGCAPAA